LDKESPLYASLGNLLSKKFDLVPKKYSLLKLIPPKKLRKMDPCLLADKTPSMKDMLIDILYSVNKPATINQIRTELTLKFGDKIQFGGIIDNCSNNPLSAEN
jgi:hypothetical protein